MPLGPLPDFAFSEIRAILLNLGYRAPILLDYFVGSGLQRQRHGEAERFRGLEVDYQLELGRLLDRKRGGRRALEDARDVGAGAGVIVDGIAAVTDQPAGGDELARVIDRGQR